MESDSNEELDKNEVSEFKNRSEFNGGKVDDDDDFSLSITPPCVKEPDNKTGVHQESDSSISEHLSLQGSSIENDRSLPEIELGSNNNSFFYMGNLPFEEGVEVLSDNLKNTSLNDDIRNILEEILNSEQFSSNSLNSNDEALDIFANLDLNDKGLTERILEKPESDDAAINIKFKDEDINKDDFATFLALELDSLREMVSNPSTTSTEYKQINEEYQKKLAEYYKGMEEKEQLILELTKSLQQSIINREELKAQVEYYENELQNMNKRLENAPLLQNKKDVGLDLIKKLEEVENVSQNNEGDFEDECLKLQKTLNFEQRVLLNDLRSSIAKYVQDKVFHNRMENEEVFDSLKKTVKEERNHHNEEMDKLKRKIAALEKNSRDVNAMKREMDAKHEKEMEDLRHYFEQKCADVQKNFSDEVYSQHSRKRSDSTSSEEDLPFDNNRPGPGGDAPAPPTKHPKFSRNKLISLCRKLKEFHQNFLTDDDLDKIVDGQSERMKIQFAELSSKLYPTEIEAMRIRHEDEMRKLNDEHEKEVEALREALSVTSKSIMGTSTAVQEVSSGDFEITEVVQSYERRLQEQIALAKLDLVAALEKQIQKLAAGNAEDDEWPTELLALRDKFRERYELETFEMRTRYETEIDNLKEQLSRHRRSSRENDHVDAEERNSYKKQVELLRRILGELLKYFTQCEDEVNNTIVDTLLRQGMEKNLTDIERELNDSTSSSRSEITTGKRVHLTPNIKDILTLLESSSERDTELSDFRNELDQCLDKLRAEANAVLELSVNFTRTNCDVPETTFSSLTRRLIDEVRTKQEFKDRVIDQQRVIDSLENERVILERQVAELVERSNVTQGELEKARVKISQLVEDGRREIVSEGFGENSGALGPSILKGEALETFKELQEQARWLISKAPSSDQELLHLVEKLLKVGEKIIDEWNSEKRDLEQQVDQLEARLEEAANHLDVQTKRCKEIETEKNEAVDKIFFLRDVIRDLEAQIKQKTETEFELRTIISDLECLIPEQGPADSPSRNINASDAQKVRDHIARLESEVQRLRLGQELVGSEGPIKELKNQLMEIENILERRTKELEEAHTVVSTTTCSSPSEEMSIREVVRPKTPNTSMNECEVPLQQLARLKEKLIRHSRVEDAAMKRIRDLEMQVFGQKSAIDEYQTEKEILKKEIADQLVLISSLQIRLDEQRIRAEHIERQTNTSLESHIYDLQKEVTDLQERLHQRNKLINQLETVVKETKSKLEEKESEVDDEIIITMQKEIEHLRNQNELLHKRLNTGVDIIPNLVENIISDKNSDIESLRKQLTQAEKRLELYDSLGLDKSQISAIRNIKNSGTSLIEVASFIEMSSIDKPRRMIETSASLPEISLHRPFKHDTVFLGSTDEIKEISRIDKVSSISTPLSLKSEKRVHFNVDDKDERLEKLSQLESNIEFIQNKLEETQDALKTANENYEKELKERDEREKNIKVDLLEKDLHLERKEKEIELLKEDSVRKDNMYMELVKEQKLLKKQLDEMETAKNKLILELEEQLSKFRDEEDEKEKRLSILQEENGEMESLKLKLDQISNEKSNLESENEKLKTEVVDERENSQKLLKELQNKQLKIEELNNQIISLERSINNLEKQIKTEKFEKNKLEKLVNDQKTTIDKYDNETETASESIIQLENELEQLRKNLKDLRSEMIGKNEDLIKNKEHSQSLEREIDHLRELLSEKEKIIRQFKDDSNRLQTSLETIQNKMQETGNVVDLATRLRAEQIKNGELIEQLAILRAKMLSRDPMVESVELDEIAGRVREELDYSAKLDSNILEAVREESDDDSGRLRYLTNELEKKNLELSRCRMEDGNLIEKLRIKLEAATENEKEYEEIITELKTRYQALEIECSKLRSKLKAYASSKSESTQYKDLPPKEDPELNKLRQETRSLGEEIAKLRSDLKTSKKSRREFEANNKYLKEELALKKRETERLEEKLSDLTKNDGVLVEKLAKCNEELREKSDEIERSNNLLREIQKEKEQFKKEIELLKRRPSADPILPVEDQLIDKIQEISTIFRNDKRTMELIIKLTTENKKLKNRVFQLESEGDVASIDPLHRANYLFAKCLRVESFQKALVWQKRYLISLLGSYENVAGGFSGRRRIPFSGIRKFKSAVYAVIVILRMKYLVRRWRSGVRFTENVNSRYERVSNQSSTSRIFHLGQPVSSRQFETASASAYTRRNSDTTDMPMFSASPPCREKSMPRQSRSNSNIEILRAPHLLSQYAERCNRLQENLGSILSSIDQ